MASAGISTPGSASFLKFHVLLNLARGRLASFRIARKFRTVRKRSVRSRSIDGGRVRGDRIRGLPIGRLPIGGLPLVGHSCFR